MRINYHPRKCAWEKESATLQFFHPIAILDTNLSKYVKGMYYVVVLNTIGKDKMYY